MKNPKEFIHNENGATIVYVAIILGVLVMFTALAIDVNHLYGVRNELQNAADAGALAGASKLLSEIDGTVDGDAARQEGARIGSANKSGNQTIAISVDGCGPGDECDVEVGHWSFTNREFTRSEDDQQYENWETTSAKDLDTIVEFINAVKVTARRTDTPSFFARIFGYDDFSVGTDAVAYIGFAGTLYPDELDKPIAICKDAILKDGALNCNVGRMLNSGGNASTSMTAMWTNFTQPCDTADNKDMTDLTTNCSTKNPNQLDFGEGIGSVNGVQDGILANIKDCWIAEADSDDEDTIPDQFWPLRLPVVECGVSNTCAPLAGAVEVNVVWIIHKNDPLPQMDDVPTKMEDWSCTTTTTRLDRFNCWKSFVNHFGLQNLSGPPVSDADYEDMYQKKNIFFKPDCTIHEPAGNSGGENFGILARIPKLVD